MTKPVSDRNSIQVIARVADIMRLLAEEPDGLSIGEIAERTSLPRSTVQRIVRALADEQFLAVPSARGGVKLGPLLLQLGANAQGDVARQVLPVMQRLARQTGESVDLSALRGASAFFVDQVAGSHRLSAVSSPGQSFPLQTTANGKALLASLPSHRCASLLKQIQTKDPSVDLTALAAEVREAQRTGLSFDREEHTVGICAIGTWFLDPLGRSFALSIPVPTVRFTEIDKLGRLLCEARDMIRSDLFG